MNVNFEYSKTLAIEGAILLLLGLVSKLWDGYFQIVGIVLLLQGNKKLSYYY